MQVEMQAIACWSQGTTLGVILKSHSTVVFFLEQDLSLALDLPGRQIWLVSKAQDPPLSISTEMGLQA